MLNKKPKAIIFDWDNTLANTRNAAVDSLDTTLLHFGLEKWEIERHRKDPKKSLRNNFPVLFGEDRAEEAYEMYLNEYVNKNFSKVELMPYAKEMLHNLVTTDIKLILISNKDISLLEKEAAATEVSNMFCITLGGDEVKSGKPSSEPVELALGKLGIEADKDVWMVGDLVQQDVASAEEAGCQPILFGEGYKEKYNDIVNEKVAAGSLVLIKDHEELDDLVRRVTK